MPNYKIANLTINNGKFGLSVQQNFGSINIDGKDFDAIGFAVRAPAEHQIEGQTRSPVEIQIVHTERTTQNLVIVSVLLDEGEYYEASSAVTELFAPFLNSQGAVTDVKDFDLNLILDWTKPTIWYSGSLTAPPCTEGITWAVIMGTNDKISKKQVGELDGLFKNNDAFAKGRGNNRITQSLNDRKLTLRYNCGVTGAIACSSGSSDDGQEIMV
jgi:carbonic anhydrase